MQKKDEEEKKKIQDKIDLANQVNQDLMERKRKEEEENRKKKEEREKEHQEYLQSLENQKKGEAE